MKKIGFIITFLLFLLLRSVGAEEVLTWQDCIKEAQKNHPDLISAQESIKESEATKKITSSALFPQLTSSADASRAQTSTSTTKRTANTFSYGVTTTQLLFDGFKTTSDVKAASEDLKAAQYSYKFVSTEVRLALRIAFINLLKAQELLNITQEIYNIRRNNLELITLRYESGMEHKGALLTAEANLAQAKFGIRQAERSLESAQRGLIKEMGRLKFSPLRVSGTFEVSDTALEKPDLEALAKNNPSLEKLIAQKNSAAFGIRSAQASFLPEISATGGASRSGSHWTPRNDQWNAGLSLSFPIFEGGLKFAELAKARALYNQAQADERSTRDEIILALEQYWVALQDAVETVEVKNKFLLASEERAKIAEAQYSTGFIAYDNWSIIEDSLVSTKTDYLNAKANALLAEANWIQAKGEVLENAQ